MAKSKAQRVQDAINKKFKRPVASTLAGGIRSDVKLVIPTGIEVIDQYVLGIGGLPAGRMVELFSAEGVGKTSLMLACLGSVQRMGGVGIFAETEVALESHRPATFGVDPKELVLLEPEHLEDLFAQAEAAVASVPKGTPALFAWDSVAATPSKEELDKGLAGKDVFDKRAKTISHAMRILGPLAAERQVALLWVNQVRANIGVLFGPDTITPGGHAMKFHASVRLCMYPGKAIKGPGGQHTGKTPTVQAVKSRFCPPWRKAKVRLDYEHGWDDDWSTLWHAKEMKLVPPRSRDVAAARAALDASGWTGMPTAAAGEDEFDGEEI